MLFKQRLKLKRKKLKLRTVTRRKGLLLRGIKRLSMQQNKRRKMKLIKLRLLS
jgi:hypothetical protein